MVGNEYEKDVEGSSHVNVWYTVLAFAWRSEENIIKIIDISVENLAGHPWDRIRKSTAESVVLQTA
jgi:hypothetical protein